MDIKLTEHSLKIIPAPAFLNNGDSRVLDITFIENVLGLIKDGDSVMLIRKNSGISPDIAYLEAKKVN